MKQYSDSLNNLYDYAAGTTHKPTSSSPEKNFKEVITPERLAIRQKLSKDKLLDPSQCGSFAEDYTLLHKKITSLPKNDPGRRVFVFDASCCGLSDRLQSVITAFAFSLMTGRALRIKWKELGMLEKVYDSPYIDWIWNPDLDDPTDESLILKIPTTESKEDRFQWTDLRLWGRDKLQVRWEIGPGQLHKLYENPYHRDYLIQELGLDAYSSFRCFYNYIFRPKLEVMKLLEVPLKLLGTTPERILSSYEWDSTIAGTDVRPIFIGIQVRVGDDALGGGEVARCPRTNATEALSNSINSYYFKCAEQIESDRVLHHQETLKAGGSKVSLSALYYLLSDCQSLRKAAKEHYKGKLITLEASEIAHIEHGAAEDAKLKSLQLAVGEHFLFGLMDYAIITSWSSYGRCAVLRSLNTGTNIYRVDGEKKVEDGVQCGEDDYTPWRQLGM